MIFCAFLFVAEGGARSPSKRQYSAKVSEIDGANPFSSFLVCIQTIVSFSARKIKTFLLRALS